MFLLFSFAVLAVAWWELGTKELTSIFQANPNE